MHFVPLALRHLAVLDVLQIEVDDDAIEPLFVLQTMIVLRLDRDGSDPLVGVGRWVLAVLGNLRLGWRRWLSRDLLLLLLLQH